MTGFFNSINIVIQYLFSMSKGVSYRTRIWIFLTLFFCGIGFGVWSMLIPPGGVISSSVLVLIAQIFVLAASVYGFEVHFDIKEGQFHAGHQYQDEQSQSS